MLETVNHFVWGLPALVMILGVGIYLSIKTRFAQLRFLPKALRKFWEMLLGKDQQGSFQALCTALAATVGTGNIVGVAGAISLGGPGSIFWMWVCGLMGMVTKYAEAVLAVTYREKGKAGPMYIIRQGLGGKWRWLACVYSIFGCVAAFGVGNATQINAVVQSAASAAHDMGLEFTEGQAVLVAAVIGGLGMWCLLGGGKRVGKVASFLVPLASLAYLLLCLGALIGRWDHIMSAIAQIFLGAFYPKAVTGGLVGSTFVSLRVGASRGVFTNEAGMGTAAMAHGTANPKHPADQGLMGIMEVFLDTIVICTMTALVILTSGVSVSYGVDGGANLTSKAFSMVYGPWVSTLLALFLAIFAYATILGWGFYGLCCVDYLLGPRSKRPFVFLMTLGGIAGVLLDTGPVWMLSETVNGLMALPNLLVLALLSSQVVKVTRQYKNRL